MRKKASNWRAQYDGTTFSRLFGHLTVESCNIPRAPDVIPSTNVSRPQTLARSHSHSSTSGNERVSGDEISATYSPGKTAHLVYKSPPPRNGGEELVL